MKKKIAVIVSAVHLALWVALMVLCAAAWIVYDGSGEEPIGAAMTMGIFGVLFVAAALGVISSVLWLLAMLSIPSEPNIAHKGGRVTAICLSAAAALLFDASVAMFIRSEASMSADISVILFPIAWLVCLICGSILLAVFSGKTKAKKIALTVTAGCRYRFCRDLDHGDMLFQICNPRLITTCGIAV